MDNNNMNRREQENLELQKLNEEYAQRRRAILMHAQKNTQNQNYMPSPLKEKKEGFLKKLWNKTIFPDMIKAKKDEKEWKRKIAYEAKKKAREEVMEEAIKIEKQKQIDMMTGNKKNDFLQKLADGFAGSGEGVGSTEKMNQMLGINQRQQPQQQQPPPQYYPQQGYYPTQGNYPMYPPNPIIKRVKKAKQKPRVIKRTQQQPPQKDYFEERIRRML